MMKATVYGMSCREIIIFPAISLPTEKEIQVYRFMGTAGTNAIYRNINEQFTPRCSQAEN